MSAVGGEGGDAGTVGDAVVGGVEARGKFSVAIVLCEDDVVHLFMLEDDVPRVTALCGEKKSPKGREAVDEDEVCAECERLVILRVCAPTN